MSRKSNLDQYRLLDLHQQGYSTKQIAEELGVNVSTISANKRKLGIGRNQRAKVLVAKHGIEKFCKVCSELIILYKYKPTATCKKCGTTFGLEALCDMAEISNLKFQPMEDQELVDYEL